ncbi:MAG: TIGR02996 domain-containing protein [Proteobacteria bacterium]|nr:TIGR02996 domain-containing protein [Pseudomonadota bacterium]
MPFNRELEALIRAQSPNLDSYLVYADWLQAHGDPRGELISLQCALSEGTPERLPTLRERERQLLRRHGRHFLGPNYRLLLSTDLADLRWYRGFLLSASLRAHWDHSATAAELVGALLRLNSARLLEELRVGLADNEGENDYTDVVGVIASTAPHHSLSTLKIGECESDEASLSITNSGDLTPLYGAVPGLRALSVRAGIIQSGKIDLPELREFTYVTCGLRRPALHRFCAARWPRLEKLVLYLGEADCGADCTIADIERLLVSLSSLTHLTHLGLVNGELADMLPEALVRSEVLSRLHWLDLSMGLMSNAGARLLVMHARRFEHLSWLGLDQNYIGRQGQEELRRAFGDCVHLGLQNEDDARWRSVSVRD